MAGIRARTATVTLFFIDFNYFLIIFYLRKLRLLVFMFKV